MKTGQTEIKKENNATVWYNFLYRKQGGENIKTTQLNAIFWIKTGQTEI